MNLKGGSGKTTTSLALAVGAAARKRRVLLIDADPQANASLTLLDGSAAEEPTLGHVLLDQAEIGEAIRPSRVKRVDILPADARLADAALLLAEQLGRERRLRSALHAVEGDYDLLVVDAAPQLNLVTINVLNTVGELIVPVDAGLYSIVGLGRLEETIDQVRRFLDNRELRITGLVLMRATTTAPQRTSSASSARPTATWSIGRPSPTRSGSKRPTPGTGRSWNLPRSPRRPWPMTGS